MEIVYRSNGAAVEGIADRNGHRKKEGGKGKVSVGEVHKPKVRVASDNSPKHVLPQRFVSVVSEEKQKITEFFPDTTVYYYIKTRVTN